MDIKRLLEDEARIRAELQRAIDTLRQTVVTDVAAQKLEGVWPIGKSSICIGVMLSTLGSEGNWAAQTFIPKEQADAVERKLNTCSSLKKMLQEIETMVEKRAVRFSNESIRLNSKTVEILGKVLTQVSKEDYEK